MASREEGYDASFQRVNLEGRNVGATLSVRRNGNTGGGESQSESERSCCINIYVNNNTQGVNNSILVGSDVRLRDPGVRFYFHGDVKLDSKRWPASIHLVSSKPESFLIVLLLFIVSILSLLMLWS